MKITPPPKMDRWLPVFILLLAAVLYGLTLDTGLRPDELTGGDLITHQYAQVQARPSNAPGYPLYTMLGWLWFRVGRAILGWALNPVQILSAYSMLWGLASLWVLYHLLYRREVSRRNGLLAALLTLFYATTYFFWFYSVTTEQYTSAIFQTLLLVWLAVAWEADPADRTLMLMAFVSGTMLANMLTTLFILPPLLYLIFTKRPDILKNFGLIVKTTLAGLLPLISYLYVYVRGAQHSEWRGEGDWATAAEWFWQFISTQQGRDEFAPGLTLHNLITPEFPSLVWGELTWLVFIGGLVGLTLMGKRLTLFFYGTLLIYLVFVTGYRFGNWFQVILPIYPMLVLGFGRSVAWLWQRFPAGWGRAALTIGLVLLVGYRFTLSLPRANQSNLATDIGLDPGWQILNDLSESGSSVTATFEEWVALQYLSEIWGAGPMIQLQAPGSPADFISRQAAATYPELVASSAIYPQSVGANLIRRQPEPTFSLASFSNVSAHAIDFGGLMQLSGHQFDPARGLVTLYWTALAPIDTDYTISVRLWRQGQLIETAEGPLIQDHQPVWNTYPTSRWQTGEIIVDAYTFFLPASIQPDQIQIVVYQSTADGFENLGDGLIPIE